MKHLAPHKLLSAIIAVTSAVCLSPTMAGAQETDGWSVRLTPYLWMLGLDGTTASLGSDAEVDAGFSDLLDALNIAVQANVEISNGRWFIVIDPMYSQLETDLMLGPISGTVEVDMLLADLLVGFNVSPNVGVYAGVRYYDQDIKLIPNNLPSTTVGEDWTDFNAGIRLTAEINDKWSFGGKVDAAVGGDSDSALYFQAVLLRHFGERMHLDFGYRYYSVDYESGSGLTRFKWDVDHSGPVIGYSWTF
jgi:hypothetical protein